MLLSTCVAVLMCCRQHVVLSRGCGLFVGIDLVRDCNTREPATSEAEEVIYRSVLCN